MQLIVNVPDAVAVRVIDAACEMHGYVAPGVLAGGDTRAARNAFVASTLVMWLRDQLEARETATAVAPVAAKVRDDVRKAMPDEGARARSGGLLPL